MILAIASSWRVGRLAGGSLELDPWTGGVARVVTAFAFVVGLLTALAAAHQLRAIPMVLAFAAVAVMTGRRRSTGRFGAGWTRDMWGSMSPSLHGPLVLAVVVTGWYWLRQTLGAARFGFEEFDSLHYHLPHAARMAQDGHLWAINIVTPAWPVHFYPSNVELLQAAVLVAMDSELPIVLFGLVSLVLFVLAGLSLTLTIAGKERRTAAVLTALGLMVVANGGTVGYLGPGTAGNDLFATASVLAAAALAAKSPTHPRLVGIAGLAAGLAAGTKLTALLPAAALAFWVAVQSRRRARSVGIFVAAALLMGGVWYLRNLVAAGNPIPGLDVPPMTTLFDTVPFPTTQQWGASIVELRGGREGWTRLAQGWTAGHGVLWPALVALTAYGILTSWRRGGAPRAVGLFTAVTSVGYIMTPWTAFGEEVPDVMLVAATTRYALIPLSLGMILAATSVAGDSAKERATAAILVVSLAGTLRPLDAGFPSVGLAVLAALTIAVAAGFMVASVVRGQSVLMHVAAGLVITVAGAVALMAGGRYAEHEAPYTAIAAWASDHRNLRVGHVGWFATYLLYGEHRTNEVRSLRVGDALGEDGAPTTCEELVGSMKGFDVVVLGPWIRWADSYLAEHEGWAEEESPIRNQVLGHPHVRVLIDQPRYALVDARDLPPPAEVCGS